MRSNRAYWVAGGLAMALLAAWQIFSENNARIAFLFSSPNQITTALLEMVKSGTLLDDIAATSAEAFLGTVIGTTLGSAFGLALWLSKRATRIAEPFVLVAGNFPVFALAPAAIVWLGIGLGMKVFLAAFATFFVSLNLAHHGAREALERFGSAFDGFRASRLDIYSKIVVPGALDSVFSAMRVNVGLGILGAFIGEFIASQRGLGHAIIRASGLYQIDQVFAASLCIIALAVLFDRLALGIQQEKLILSRVVGVPRRLRLHSKKIVGRSS